MTRRERAPAYVLAGTVVLLLAILAAAALSAVRHAGPGGEAARVVPADALAFVRLSTDPDDPAARRLQRLAPRIPGYLALRDAALTAVSPAPGAFDLRRDVRPWLGDEAAVALVDVGGGRFGSLVLAQVSSVPRAEALLQRVAGARPAVRYHDVVLRRFGPSAAAFVGGFLVAGPEPAVRRAIDVSRGAPALADAAAFEHALDGPRRPLAAYASPRGVRGFLRSRGGVVRTLAALLDHPRLRGAGATLRAGARALRLDARLSGAGGTEVRPQLVAGVPASAIALLAGPSLAAAVQTAQRAGAAGALASVRETVRERAAIDLDREVIGRLQGEFAAWLEAGAAAPVITLAARTRDPRGTRDALARLQGPVARALAADAGAPAAFEVRPIAGAEAFTLRLSPSFAPTYAIVGDTVIASTSPAGIEAFRARRPRLRDARGFRAVAPRIPRRIESLGYVDVGRLLALAARTGLSAEVLRPVRAAAATIERDDDDATARLVFEIP